MSHMDCSEFVFSGSAPSGRSVVFSGVEGPDQDEYTPFRVQLSADGISATCSVESARGDYGYWVDPAGDLRLDDHIHLSALLKKLGSGPLWDDQPEWRSLSGELRVAFSVDDFGHTDVRFQIVRNPWQQTWSASCTLRYDLGELAMVGDDLGSWFREHLKAPRPNQTTVKSP